MSYNNLFNQNTHKSYSDPGINTCVWCLSGIYNENDYIEEIMTDKARHKAVKLGLKIQGRYYMPECLRCKENRNKYTFKEVLKYGYDVNEDDKIMEKLSINSSEENNSYCRSNKNEVNSFIKPEIEAKEKIAKNVKLVENTNQYSPTYKSVPSCKTSSNSSGDIDKDILSDISSQYSNESNRISKECKKNKFNTENHYYNDGSKKIILDQKLKNNHSESPSYSRNQFLKEYIAVDSHDLKDKPSFNDKYNNIHGANSPFSTKSENNQNINSYKGNDKYISKSQIYTKSENKKFMNNLKDKFTNPLPYSTHYENNNNPSNKLKGKYGGDTSPISTKSENISNCSSNKNRFNFGKSTSSNNFLKSPTDKCDSADQNSVSSINNNMRSEFYDSFQAQARKSLDKDQFFINITKNTEQDRNSLSNKKSNVDEEVVDITVKDNNNPFHNIKSVIPDMNHRKSDCTLNTRKFSESSEDLSMSNTKRNTVINSPSSSSHSYQNVQTYFNELAREDSNANLRKNTSPVDKYKSRINEADRYKKRIENDLLNLKKIVAKQESHDLESKFKMTLKNGSYEVKPKNRFSQENQRSNLSNCNNNSLNRNELLKTNESFDDHTASDCKVDQNQSIHTENSLNTSDILEIVESDNNKASDYKISHNQSSITESLNTIEAFQLLDAETKDRNNPSVDRETTITKNNSMDKIGNRAEILVLHEPTPAKKCEVVSGSESLITLEDCENNYEFSSSVQYTKIGEIIEKPSIPYGEKVVKFSLTVIGNETKPEEGTCPSDNGKIESIISLNKMNMHIKRHEPSSRINTFAFNKELKPESPSAVSIKSNSEKNTCKQTESAVSIPSKHSKEDLMQRFDSEVKDMLRLAEKRASINPFTCTAEKIPNQIKRFVIPGKIPIFKINDIIAINDLKMSIIRDKIHKRGRNDKFQYNWIQLKDTFLTCYNGNLNDFNDTFKEANGDLTCPDDQSVFLTRKYMIDLREYQIHIGSNVELKNGIFSYFGVRRSCSKTVDISDKNIKNVMPYGKEYRIVIKDGQSETMYYIPFLEFGLVKGNEIYSYRVENINTYLKWILAIKLRQGKVGWPIP